MCNFYIYIVLVHSLHWSAYICSILWLLLHYNMQFLSMYLRCTSVSNSLVLFLMAVVHSDYHTGVCYRSIHKSGYSGVNEWPSRFIVPLLGGVANYSSIWYKVCKYVCTYVHVYVYDIAGYTIVTHWYQYQYRYQCYFGSIRFVLVRP